MALRMSGLEHSLAPIALREQLSFTKTRTGEILKKIRTLPGIQGCVLISTCNRTELYLSCQEQQDPGQLLCQAARVPYAPYADAFVTCRGSETVQHLMEVAAGLRSRIWGEDQIITQVKNALLLAREAGTSDPVLETLFRCAVAAGKQVRSQVHLTSVPTSAAGMAVDLLRRRLGTLENRRALVIGNGEMGRLAAGLLQQAGCRVQVTLRTYRHGETLVPAGCGVVPYEERFAHMDGLDLLVSATTSPHYTVTLDRFRELSRPPAFLMDLAIPRDIQPELEALDGVTLFNIDDLSSFTEHRQVPEDVRQILHDQRENFYRWLHYRQCMGSLESLKEALVQRLLGPGQPDGDPEELVEMTVSKTVDLMVGGLSDRINQESLARCESKIRLHTRSHPGKL